MAPTAPKHARGGARAGRGGGGHEGGQGGGRGRGACGNGRVVWRPPLAHPNWGWREVAWCSKAAPWEGLAEGWPALEDLVIDAAAEKKGAEGDADVTVKVKVKGEPAPPTYAELFPGKALPKPAAKLAKQKPSRKAVGKEAPRPAVQTPYRIYCQDPYDAAQPFRSAETAADAGFTFQPGGKRGAAGVTADPGWGALLALTQAASSTERRIDAADGLAYLKVDFIFEYGGTGEWDEAEPLIAARTAPEGAGREAPPAELRIDSMDLQPYTKAEFIKAYGRTHEWDAAEPEAAGSAGPVEPCASQPSVCAWCGLSPTYPYCGLTGQLHITAAVARARRERVLQDHARLPQQNHLILHVLHLVAYADVMQLPAAAAAAATAWLRRVGGAKDNTGTVDFAAPFAAWCPRPLVGRPHEVACSWCGLSTPYCALTGRAHITAAAAKSRREQVLNEHRLPPAVLKAHPSIMHVMHVVAFADVLGVPTAAAAAATGWLSRIAARCSMEGVTVVIAETHDVGRSRPFAAWCP